MDRKENRTLPGAPALTEEELERVSGGITGKLPCEFRGLYKNHDCPLSAAGTLEDCAACPGKPEDTGKQSDTAAGRFPPRYTHRKGRK